LLSNIKQLVPVAHKQPFLSMQECTGIEPLSNYAIAVNADGIIAKVGPTQEIEEWAQKEAVEFALRKDCSNFVAIPGLVDGHTHAVFAGNRSKEFDMKLNGKTYVDIYNEGLGIRFTTESIREARLEDLVTHLEKYLSKMNRLGTTTVEVKSGYGLNAEAEVKMLRAIEIAKQNFAGKIDVIATFCGAHAIPKGKTEEEQTKDVIENQIPAVQKAMQNKEINPKFIDVFCEKKFFERESSLQIMKAGKEIGLIPSFHGDELNNLECGQLAAEVGARAVSHLEYVK
jgi:imidazolonepropionase